MKNFPGRMRRGRSGGTLLFLVVVVSIMVSGLMLAAHITYRASMRVIEQQLNHHGQAVNAAKAGLVE